MSYQVLGFQLFNLNDYGIKLFPAFKEDNLYFAKFQIVERYPDQDAHDEGSSQRSDKLLLIPSNNKEVLKSFPFTALLRDELVQVQTTKQQLQNAITLFNAEYNYLLILYMDTQEAVEKLTKYFASVDLAREEFESIRQFIQVKQDELDEKLYKESLGKDRLQKKVNPKHSKEIPLLENHIKIIEDDDDYKDLYLQLIQQFDNEFLHSENANFEYDSTAQKNVV